MNIAQTVEKIKGRQEELLTGLGIVLALGLAFGLGCWSRLGEAPKPVRIENIPTRARETSYATNTTPSQVSVPNTGQYVASRNGKKYYPVDCKSANRIKSENRVYFATAALAEAAGYSLTTTCK